MSTCWDRPASLFLARLSRRPLLRAGAGSSRRRRGPPRWVSHPSRACSSSVRSSAHPKTSIPIAPPDPIGNPPYRATLGDVGRRIIGLPRQVDLACIFDPPQRAETARTFVVTPVLAVGDLPRGPAARVVLVELVDIHRYSEARGRGDDSHLTMMPRRVAWNDGAQDSRRIAARRSLEPKPYPASSGPDPRPVGDLTRGR